MVQIELTLLPEIDLVSKGVLLGNKLRKTIREIIENKMWFDRYYVVTVKSGYYSDKARTKLRVREKHYLAVKRKLSSGTYLELSNYPAYVFGTPKILFKVSQ